MMHAERAGALTRGAMTISDYNSSSHPSYSIIVVLFADHPDVARSITRLTKYSQQDAFELVFVNNGCHSQSVFASMLNRFRWVDVGFNFGCSGGRNIGAVAARGSYIIFLDDDGLIEPDAIEKVLLRLSRSTTPWRCGDGYAQNLPTALSGPITMLEMKFSLVFQMPREFRYGDVKNSCAHGGFDILLAGREGAALWSRLYPFYGPDAFIYTPKAILLHDYARDEAHLARKRARLEKNDTYLASFYPNALKLKSMLYRHRREFPTRIKFQRARHSVDTWVPALNVVRQRVSVLTTASHTTHILTITRKD